MSTSVDFAKRLNLKENVMKYFFTQKPQNESLGKIAKEFLP